MIEEFMKSPYTVGVIIGIVFGIISRLSMLRTDYRQYPANPHGRIVHISLGVIAASLGAVAVPALLEKEYTAVTFLTLAAQQFREVRSMERETLTRIDSLELVPRGVTYIEGIAIAFEGRNYLAITTALLSTLGSVLFTWYWGVAAGLLALVLTHFFMSGKTVSQLAHIEQAEVVMKGPDLYVNDIYIMNIGLEDTREKIARHSLGFILHPKTPDFKVTLANLGQRQAILHDLSTILGVYRDSGEPSLVPQAKIDLNDGRLAVFILPQDRDPAKAMQVIGQVPVLENAVRMPSESKAQKGEAKSEG